MRRGRLSDRELEVLACMARGLSNAETAAELWLSTHTVKSHRKRIHAELGATSRRGQAVAMAHELGLITTNHALPIDEVVLAETYQQVTE